MHSAHHSICAAFAGGLNFLRVAATATLALCSATAYAAPCEILSDPLRIGTTSEIAASREFKSPNSAGETPGDFIKLGLLNVTPNPWVGVGGTLTRVTTIDPLSGLSRNLPFSYSPATPNEFSSSSQKFSVWGTDSRILTATNPCSPNSPINVATPEIRRPDGTVPGTLGFVRDASISSTGTGTTFNFSLPPESRHDRVTIRIFDRDRPTPSGASSTLIFLSNQLPGTTTGYTTPPVLNAAGDQLLANGRYTVSIDLVETGRPPPYNARLSRSSTFFDFSTTDSATPQVYMPIVYPGPVYHYDVAVPEGLTIYVAPEMAIGYEYATGTGDPNFRWVVLPNVGDGVFTIHAWDGAAWTIRGTAYAGTPFDFGVGGVSRFRVTGTEMALAKAGGTGSPVFTTGLAFTDGGKFTGTVTPMTAIPDYTPPVITPTIVGTQGNGGWYTGPVTVSWSAVDNESPVTADCPATTLTTDTGGTTLTCNASSAGGSASQSVTFRIDRTPPTLTCQASPSVLWPPNNKLVDVAVAVSNEDGMSGPAGFSLVSASSDEGTAEDIQGWSLGTADVSGKLRATRAGAGRGRLYTLVYQASDVAGNVSTCSTTVTVPHDLGS